MFQSTLGSIAKHRRRDDLAPSVLGSFLYPGVNVITVTNFRDLCRFSANKIGVFLKKML
jgi:hypothetical protein